MSELFGWLTHDVLKSVPSILANICPVVPPSGSPAVVPDAVDHSKTEPLTGQVNTSLNVPVVAGNV